MPDALRLSIDRIHTPVGELLVVADSLGKLCSIDWVDYAARMLRLLRLHYGRDRFKVEPEHNQHGLSDVIRCYFCGDIHAIDNLPVETAGTPFSALLGRNCGLSDPTDRPPVTAEDWSVNAGSWTTNIRMPGRRNRPLCAKSAKN